MNLRLCFGISAIAVVGVAVACSTSSPGSGFEDNGGGDAALPDDGGGGPDPDAAPIFGGNGDGSTGTCVNLECRQVTCPNGGTTSLSGTVYAPTPTQFGKADPIYNAIVYVPNADLKPFPKGVSCDKCGAVTSGSPIAVALSGSDGKFKITNVPTGDNVPLVFQVGRWRRKVVVPHVAECQDTPLDAESTRLPRDHTEGDIPLMAITTSYYDPTQCIMRKIGVADSEFTAPTGTGRIHLYQGGGMNLKNATLPQGNTLWGDATNPSKLKDYDIVALPCLSHPSDMTGRTNIVDYTSSGGRVYITDLSVDVMSAGPAPWPSVASWTSGFIGTTTGTVDQTFPKGQALADWLQAIGATTSKGVIALDEVYSRFTATTQQRWLYNPTNPLIFSYNTPLGADAGDQCGRAIYASFHVATPTSGTFPDSCDTQPLTPQEKVLEFMLFDLAACVQTDGSVPQPPPIK
jgi:hypothetical protein